MAIQLISPIHNSVPPDREQFQLLTLWKELSPEQQRQLAQRLAELIQRIQMSGPALQEKSHEDI
jgi:hypothetical protein